MKKMFDESTHLADNELLIESNIGQIAKLTAMNLKTIHQDR